MNHARDYTKNGVAPPRKKRRRCAILALATTVLLAATACDEEEGFRTFRSAAATSLQSGINSIMDGVVDGLFAVFKLTDSDSGTTTS